MPSSITQLVIGIAVAIGIAVVSVGAIGSSVAQSPIEKAQLISCLYAKELFPLDLKQIACRQTVATATNEGRS